MPQLFFTLGKHLVPIVQEAGWAPGPVWTGAENLASSGIRSPHHPAHSQSLYRLSYLGPQLNCSTVHIGFIGDVIRLTFKNHASYT
jgi:hypothetical protein